MNTNQHEPMIPGICDFCGGPIPAHLARARFCCVEHRNQARNLRRRGTRTKAHRGDRPCVRCGVMMIDVSASRKYCGSTCSKAATVEAERERRHERKAARTERAQAPEPQAEQEPGAHLGTFVRRGVTCRWCRAKNVTENGLCADCNRVEIAGREEEAARAKDRGGRYDLPHVADWRNRAANVARAKGGTYNP